jgi:uncharacterized cupredoxin-like copper-binding protein
MKLFAFGLALAVLVAVPFASACGDDDSSSSSTGDALSTARANAAKTVQSLATQVVTQAQGAVSAVASKVADVKAVGAKLTDSSIDLERSTTLPGDNTFDITNNGTSEHDLIVLKTDLAVDQLPVKNNKVDTSASGIDKVGSKTNIKAGDSTTLKVDDLKSGKYVVISNHDGDYAAGMRVGFSVP